MTLQKPFLTLFYHQILLKKQIACSRTYILIKYRHKEMTFGNQRLLTMTADLNENYRIYIDQTPPVPAGILRVTDGAAVFLETKKPLTVKDAKSN